MTENDDRKGCWNCTKAISVNSTFSCSAIICREQLKEGITEVEDMRRKVCDRWERKWRDTETCPFFSASEYDVNGDRSVICMYDLTTCESLGCHKGEDYSEERIRQHIAIMNAYSVIVGDEHRALSMGKTFDEYMDYRKSLLDNEKSEYKKYLQELKDIENL